MATKHVPAWARDATWAAECGAVFGRSGGEQFGRERYKMSGGKLWASDHVGGRWSEWTEMGHSEKPLVSDAKSWPRMYPNFRIVKGGRS